MSLTTLSNPALSRAGLAWPRARVSRSRHLLPRTSPSRPPPSCTPRLRALWETGGLTPIERRRAPKQPEVRARGEMLAAAGRRSRVIAYYPRSRSARATSAPSSAEQRLGNVVAAPRSGRSSSRHAALQRTLEFGRAHQYTRSHLTVPLRTTFSAPATGGGATRRARNGDRSAGHAASPLHSQDSLLSWAPARLQRSWPRSRSSKPAGTSDCGRRTRGAVARGRDGAESQLARAELPSARAEPPPRERGAAPRRDSRSGAKSTKSAKFAGAAAGQRETESVQKLYQKPCQRLELRAFESGERRWRPAARHKAGYYPRLDAFGTPTTQSEHATFPSATSGTPRGRRVQLSWTPTTSEFRRRRSTGSMRG